MTDQASSTINDPLLILKNANNSVEQLREALKTKDPWDRDVEFLRRDARRQYLHLIFMFPYSPQSLALDNPMWIETSHASIAAYRAKIAILDKAIASKSNLKASNEGSSVEGSSKAKQQHHHQHGPVEHRKLVQRFRQFLAEEEKFWSAFIVRFVRAFALQEAEPHLDALQLKAAAADDPSSVRKSTFPEEGIPCEPPEHQREKKIVTLVKALISLGDLARYKEQYNERQGRAKVGSEEPLSRWATKGNRKTGDSAPRPRNYARAIACYTQARLLYPESGQASHQLAILSAYQSDTFESILHYYRSICVKHPFVMAQENLHRTLLKAYELQKNEPEEVVSEQDPPRVVVDRFKRGVVRLHALWRAVDSSAPELAKQARQTIFSFNFLLAERLLPIGLIIKVYTASLGALWSLRLRAKSKKEPKAVDGQMESVILAHVMDLHLGLVKLAIKELSSTPASASGIPSTAPAERITAVLRRILQSLRVASKWVVANQDYLSRTANPEKEPHPSLARTLGEFWPAYATFITTLATTFPKQDLRGVPSVVLEEDVELSAFTPLKGSLKSAAKNGSVVALNQVHPNDEYLLRIRDVLKDAVTLTKSEVTPLTHQNGVYTSRAESPAPTPISAPRRDTITEFHAPGAALGNGNSYDLVARPGEDEDVASVSTEDPVTMAMRATLDPSENGEYDQELDEEEDQILYPQGTWTRVDPRYDATPMLGPHMTLTSTYHPVVPLRDPHAFNLADLSTHPEFAHSHPPQLPSPQREVFGASASPFANAANPLPPMLGYQDSLGLTRPYLPLISSPPRQVPPTLPSSPYFAPGPIAPPIQAQSPTNYAMYGSGTPLTPLRHAQRLSIGPNTPTNMVLAELSPTTPPRTGQDLLMRVLGGGSGAGASGTSAGRARQSTSPPRARNASPESRPPLLFGASNGNSIWAP